MIDFDANKLKNIQNDKSQGEGVNFRRNSFSGSMSIKVIRTGV